jgi:hypothetical protein
MNSKTFYTVHYIRPKQPAQVQAMLRTLVAHNADISTANEPKRLIIATWDSAVDEVAFNTAWKEEAPKYLDCVAESVLATMKDIDGIESVGVPFEELFYYCDECLAEHDVEEAIADLETMGLVELQQGGGWILKTDICIAQR